MDNTLKTKLVNALTKAGMSEGIADAFNDQETDAVEKFIKSITPNTAPTMEDIVGSAAFESYIEQGGFDKLLAKSKKAQSEFDKKTTKALNTFRQNLLGDNSGGDDGSDPDTATTDKGNKALVEMIAKLSDKIDNLEKAKTTETKLEKAKGLLIKSKLPAKVQEKWLSRINVDSDLTEQIAALETEYVDLVGEQPDTIKFDQSRGRKENGKLSQTETKELQEFAKKL